MRRSGGGEGKKGGEGKGEEGEARRYELNGVTEWGVRRGWEEGIMEEGRCLGRDREVGKGKF